MPLPVGFKVNGSKVEHTSGGPVPPSVKKAIAFLDRQANDEVFTSVEFFGRIGLAINSGGVGQHPALRDYREKIDGKLFWGSRKSIERLRKQLAETEEPRNEN